MLKLIVAGFIGGLTALIVANVVGLANPFIVALVLLAAILVGKMAALPQGASLRDLLEGWTEL